MIKYEQLTLYYFSEGETKALESYYPSSHFLNIKCQVLMEVLFRQRSRKGPLSPAKWEEVLI